MTDEQWERYIELVLRKSDLTVDAMQAELKEPPAELKEVNEELSRLRALAIKDALRNSKDEEFYKTARVFKGDRK